MRKFNGMIPGMKKGLWIIILAIGSAALVWWGLVNRIDQTPLPRSNLLSSGDVPSGFKRALPPAQITFPDDFGPHPEFQTEWWYYTGNLTTAQGRKFGYQFTIFRRGLVPEAFVVERDSAWGTNQVYLAHFALTDIQKGEHTAVEEFARGAAQIAGAQASPYRVWLKNWFVEETGPQSVRLFAEHDDFTLDLVLEDLKGPILQGLDGYSQKGPDPGNASYYYSQTRLDTRGMISVSDETFTVTGYSWKDHEYSTSALSENQVGWDWFALQLEDNTELKVFHIRQTDGSIDPYSSGSFVDQNGTVTRLAKDDFIIQVDTTWVSPQTGAEYPAGWTILVPALGINLKVTPYVADQELVVSYAYWEGAVSITGTSAGQTITGSGYAELTGYAASMAGEF
jgi:predicted secreted hydrolase